MEDINQAIFKVHSEKCAWTRGVLAKRSPVVWKDYKHKTKRRHKTEANASIKEIGKSVKCVSHDICETTLMCISLEMMDEDSATAENEHLQLLLLGLFVPLKKLGKSNI